jgi:hypothetical protein
VTISVEQPDLLNSLAQQAMAQSEDAPVKRERPRIEPPENDLVQLSGGYLNFNSGDYDKVARVRELNGYDEEKLARVPNSTPARLLNEILELGTVSIGDTAADRNMLDDLLLGDRDSILLGIRVSTFGPQLEMGIVCPACEAPQDVSFDLTEDVPFKELSSQEERTFLVELSKGKVALVNLPTGRTQKALLQADGKTTAQLNTILLAGCVQSIDDMPLLGGTQKVLELSIPDRETLITEILNRSFGPQFGEVKLPCGQCSQVIDLPLTLADLFRL